MRSPPDPFERVVYVDVEMTGHATVDPCIVEIAAVEVVGGLRTGKVFHSYVNPDTDINPFAQKVHGLSRDFLKDKPRIGELAPGFIAFLGDSPVMMHGAANDVAAINHDFALAGAPRLDSKRVFDSQRIARHIFSGAAMGMDTLCDVLGVDRTARKRGHSAIVDATLLAECGMKMARLNDYAAITQSGLKRNAERKANNPTERSPIDRDVVVSLTDDRRTAVFDMKDGTRIEAEVPDFPDTHQIVVHPKSGAVLVLRIPPDIGQMPPGFRHPDNPDGPAVLVCRQGKVERIWFSDGKPIDPPEVADESPRLGM